MNTSQLKKFAQAARRLLLEQVRAQMDAVLAEGGLARRESANAVNDLEKETLTHGKERTVEKAAYIWFNRFTALMFMDVNGYTPVRVTIPADGETRPQILSDAMANEIDATLPERTRARIHGLLSGEISSRDPQAEAYRLLLVEVCNHWHAAMPFMFERIADWTELLMPADLLSQTSVLARMREVMDAEACQDVEIIGWLYQFYISEKKDQVFDGLKKNVKITPENIPAATQLFTPHWIVRYLVENSLGRLWMLNRPASKLIGRMDYYIAPEQPEVDFLRVSSPEEIRICDPACGSGHMLTYAFDLLYAMYEEEGYDPSDIPEKILTKNLYGIEIDDRAGALAAFALTMKARAVQARFFRRNVAPNICVLENVSFSEQELADYVAEIEKSGGRDLFTADLKDTLRQFEQAKNFGSLIVPKLHDVSEIARRIDAQNFEGKLFLRDVHERVRVALRMSEALSPKYHVVVANPPYGGAKGLNTSLAGFLTNCFPKAKSDLMTVFMQRSLGLTFAKGLFAGVTLDSWMFLATYSAFRETVFESAFVRSLVHVGWNCFPDGHVYNRGTMFVLCHQRSNSEGLFVRLAHLPATAIKEREFLKRRAERDFYHRCRSDFESISGQPLAFWFPEAALANFRQNDSLSSFGEAKSGMSSCNSERFLRAWTEISVNRSRSSSEPHDTKNSSDAKWYPYNKGGGNRRWYGYNDTVINWADNGSEIKDFVVSNPQDPHTTHWSRRLFNLEFFFLPGITWSAVTSSRFSCRNVRPGVIPGTGSKSIFVDPEIATSKNILGFLNSTVAAYFLEALSPTINFEAGDIGKLPIPENLNISPSVEKLTKHARADWDAYETSWDFTTLPLLLPDHRGDTLQGCYARLRTRWQDMTDEMQRLEEANNRIFIDAYGLQDELTPEVPIEEITLTCNPAYRYGGSKTEDELETLLRTDSLRELVSYAVGCMFGRYSLNVPGLILANQGETLQDYLARVPQPAFTPDTDNVLPILDGDWFPDDITSRFREFLTVTFGAEKFQENLAFIEEALGKDIRRYFLRDFYKDHVKRYKKRPIYWLFSSPKGSFNALIYMHRYRPDTVSVILNDYLRAFRAKLVVAHRECERTEVSQEASQREKTLALKEKTRIEEILAEVDAYERDTLFPLASQKIEIDLDDGVKVNYLKFGDALAKIPGLEAKDDG